VIGLEENIHCTAIWWSTRFWKLNGHKCFWLPRNIILNNDYVGDSYSWLLLLTKEERYFSSSFSSFFCSLYALYINLNVVLSRTHLTTTKFDYIWKMLGGHPIEIER